MAGRSDVGGRPRCEALPGNEEQGFPVSFTQPGQCVDAGITLGQLLLRGRSSHGVPRWRTDCASADPEPPRVGGGWRPACAPSPPTGRTPPRTPRGRRRSDGDVVDPTEGDEVGLGNEVFGIGRIRVTSGIGVQSACVLVREHL